MLPVSQAVQANKATSARSSKESDASPAQGFNALFEQGLAKPAQAGTPPVDATTPGSTASARLAAASRSNAAVPPTPPASAGTSATSTAESATGDGRHTDTTRDPSPTPQSDAASSPSDPKHKSARSAHPSVGAADLALALSGALPTLINPGLPAPLSAPAATSAPGGREGLAGRSGGLALRGGTLPIPGTSASSPSTGADVQATAGSGRAAAGRQWQSDGPAAAFDRALNAADGGGAAASGTNGTDGLANPAVQAAAPADTGGAEAAGALGAGLNALLGRNAIPFSSAAASSFSTALSAANAIPHGAGGASLSAVTADSAQMYAQMAQNLAATPSIDPGMVPTGAISLPLTPTVGDERWASALGQQALFMVGKQISSAQLTLNPPNLGPIQVTLDMRHDQASATFVTPHDAVRQAIEASLPHLRDLFSAAGLHLEQAQVQANAGNLSGGAPGQQFNQSGQGSPRWASAGSATGTSMTGIGTSPGAGSPLPILRSRGLLDTFA